MSSYRGPIKIPMSCLSMHAYWNLRATKVIYVKLGNGENFMKILSLIKLIYFNDHFTTCPKCIWALTVVLVPTYILLHNISASLLQKLTLFYRNAGNDSVVLSSMPCNMHMSFVMLSEVNVQELQRLYISFWRDNDNVRIILIDFSVQLPAKIKVALTKMR